MCSEEVPFPRAGSETRGRGRHNRFWPARVGLWGEAETPPGGEGVKLQEGELEGHAERQRETEGQRQGLPEMETERDRAEGDRGTEAESSRDGDTESARDGDRETEQKRQSGKDSIPEIETQKNRAEIKIEKQRQRLPEIERQRPRERQRNRVCQRYR